MMPPLKQKDTTYLIQHVDYGLDEKGIAGIKEMYSLKKGELQVDSS